MRPRRRRPDRDRRLAPPGAPRRERRPARAGPLGGPAAAGLTVTAASPSASPPASPMVTTAPERAEVPPPATVPPHEVAPDVLMRHLFVNTYALRTPDGLLLVDPGLLRHA